MKLNSSQREQIEIYLLDFGLEYRDFYEEMLDHFVLNIENALESGQDFGAAFEKTKAQFAKKRFKSGFFEPFRYGIKALELEVVKEKSKFLRKTIWGNFFKQLSSKGVFLWLAFLWLIIWVGQQYGYEKAYWLPYSFLIITVFAQVYFMPKAAVFTNFSFWLEKYSAPNRRKEKTLYPCMDVVIFRNTSSSLFSFFLIPFLIAKLEAVANVPFLQYFLCTVLVLLTIYQFVVFKMAYQAHRKTLDILKP